MPWCPVCKNEYKEGYEVCSDCGAKLVDSLEDIIVPVYFADEEKIDGIIDFLTANNLYAVKRQSQNNEPADSEDADIESFDVCTKQALVKDVVKAIGVYLSQFADEEDEDAKEDVSQFTPRYEDTQKRAEDYKSGSLVLIFVGIIGAIALVLINLGIIPLALYGVTKILIDVVMGILFLIFIIVGVMSYRSYLNLKDVAGLEDELENNIRTWLDTSVNMNDLTEGESEDSETPSELLYLTRCERLKKQIIDNFPDADIAFVDHIVEEVYDSLFED